MSSPGSCVILATSSPPFTGNQSMNLLRIRCMRSIVFAAVCMAGSLAVGSAHGLSPARDTFELAVNFLPGSSGVSAQARRTLTEFVLSVRDKDYCPVEVVIVSGVMAVPLTSPDVQKALAFQRADAVASLLVRAGLPAEVVFIERRGASGNESSDEVDIEFIGRVNSPCSLPRRAGGFRALPSKASARGDCARNPPLYLCEVEPGAVRWWSTSNR
ncbi:MAG: OmpA family [Pseudomonadota bacterium]|jgi:hypothetical protein